MVHHVVPSAFVKRKHRQHALFIWLTDGCVGVYLVAGFLHNMCVFDLYTFYQGALPCNSYPCRRTLGIRYAMSSNSEINANK
jgi:hypothetical protein